MKIGDVIVCVDNVFIINKKIVENIPITKGKQYVITNIIKISGKAYLSFINDNNVFDHMDIDYYIPSRFRMLEDYRQEKLELLNL